MKMLMIKIEEEDRDNIGCIAFSIYIYMSVCLYKFVLLKFITHL